MSGPVEALRGLLPDGWDLEDAEMGMDTNLICPHGHVTEQNGYGPDGCESPFITLGLV